MKTLSTCLCAMALILGLSGTTDALPFVDTTFTYKSPNDDTDFVVVRENYDPSTHQHALYFRVFDGPAADWEAFGGTITFSPGISVVDVYYLRDASWDNSLFVGSDNPWGIAGGDYTDVYRGMEPWGLVGADSIGWDEHSISFDGSFRTGMDDFRVIIDYGDSFPLGAYLDLALLTGDNPYGYPYVAGIQVGNLDRVVPGSGDFGEITDLRIPLTPVPEPSTVFLLGSGLIGLATLRRRFWG